MKKECRLQRKQKNWGWSYKLKQNAKFLNMRHLLEKYEKKLVESGLVEKDEPILGGLDAELSWNRDDPLCTELEKVFDGLNINSLLYAKPSEPYLSIFKYLAEREPDAILPNDSETRTFLHDLPVISHFDTDKIIEKLKSRKSVIIPGEAIITWGMVSPEQAFIFYSSVCFAGFVKFFTDYLYDKKEGKVTAEQQQVFDMAKRHLDNLPDEMPSLMKGPFKSVDEVYDAIFETGRKVVEYRLVDSFFGNISYLYDNVLYISQTTSSLDELEGCIDPCPLDGSNCSSITASSEYIAHKDMVERTGKRGVLHGHPKFSVIMSLYCDKKKDCEFNKVCYKKCPETRLIDGNIPIVPGEPGAGTYGLCHTVPSALEKYPGVIVYGHGVFTVVENDFNSAFGTLMDIEKQCRDEYFRLLS